MALSPREIVSPAMETPRYTLRYFVFPWGFSLLSVGKWEISLITRLLRLATYYTLGEFSRLFCELMPCAGKRCKLPNLSFLCN